jgi:hypothetical protein
MSLRTGVILMQGTQHFMLGVAPHLASARMLVRYVHCRGLEIYVRELGPFYRIVCREGRCCAPQLLLHCRERGLCQGD